MRRLKHFLPAAAGHRLFYREWTKPKTLALALYDRLRYKLRERWADTLAHAKNDYREVLQEGGYE